MEHLPKPVDRPNRPKVHFYVEQRLYTPGEFFTLPEEYGCDDYDSLLENGLPEDMPVSKANTFLQSWLYFSLLSQVLGVPIQSGDFLGHDRETVDTGDQLNDLLREWAKREQAEAEKTEQHASRHHRTSTALEHARRIINKHLFYERMNHSSEYQPAHSEIEPVIHSKVDKKLTLSIAILGETLQQIRPALPNNLHNRISFSKHPSTIERSWGCSTYCRDLMSRGSWCPSEIHCIESTLPTVSQVYYVSTVQKERPDVSHESAGCTPFECLVQRPRRQPIHSCHHGNCVTEGINEQDIVDIIKAGKTPLVTWTRQPNPRLQLHAYDLSRDPVIFGALSHSWEEDIVASGLDERPGNNRRMHVCQIANLQKSFNHLIKPNDERSGKDNIPFWIDVLCFPRNTDVKGDAIDQLKTIYSQADAVIVWDRNLMKREKLSDEDIIEMNVRIRTGDWAQRLWTLQEAVLARKLYVQFSGPTFLSLHDIEEARDKARADITNKYHHIWSAGDPFSAAIWGLRTRKDCQVQRAWEAVQFRQRRHPEEEALVIASILGLRTDQIANIQSDYYSPEAIAERRMVRLLEQLEETPGLGIPSGLIFLLKPHHNASAISLPGFGWAPKTWMGRQPLKYALFGPIRQTALLLRRGLQVQLPGVILHRPNQRYTSSTFHIPVQESLHKWWKIRIDVPECDAAAFWREVICPLREPSIILSVGNPGQRAEVGLLVVTNGMLDGNVRWVKVICRAWVRLETHSPKIGELCNEFRRNADWMGFGERLPPVQKWCVDGSD